MIYIPFHHSIIINFTKVPLDSKINHWYDHGPHKLILIREEGGAPIQWWHPCFILQSTIILLLLAVQESGLGLLVPCSVTRGFSPHTLVFPRAFFPFLWFSLISVFSIRAAFKIVKSNYVIVIAMLCDWFTIHAWFSPCFNKVSGNYLEFWLVYSTACFCLCWFVRMLTLLVVFLVIWKPL